MIKNLISFESNLKFVEVFDDDCGFQGEKGYVNKCTAIFEAEGREEKSNEILVSFIGSKACEFMDDFDAQRIYEGQTLTLKLNISTRFWVNDQDNEIPITEITCWSFYALDERRSVSRRPDHSSPRRSGRNENETNRPAYRNMPEEVPEVEEYAGTGRDGRSVGRRRGGQNSGEKKTEAETERKRYAPK